MSLGTKVGFGTGHIVLDGNPASPPQNLGTAGHFLAHVYCTVTKPGSETHWNLLGCPKLVNRSQPLIGWSSPRYCLAHYVKTWHHPQNRKYTLHLVRGRPNRSHRQHVQKISRSLNMWFWDMRADRPADRHTDRHADRNSLLRGGAVIIESYDEAGRLPDHSWENPPGRSRIKCLDQTRSDNDLPTDLWNCAVRPWVQV